MSITQPRVQNKAYKKEKLYKLHHYHTTFNEVAPLPHNLQQHCTSVQIFERTLRGDERHIMRMRKQDVLTDVLTLLENKRQKARMRGDTSLYCTKKAKVKTLGFLK